MTQPANPFEEEKAEARSGSSTGGNSPASDTPIPSRVPRPPPRVSVTMSQARADSLLFALAEPKLHVSINTYNYIQLTLTHCCNVVF